MAQLNRLPLEYSVQTVEHSDIDYSAASNSQPISVYSGQQSDLSSTQQSIGITSTEHNDGSVDQKPALPPKPFQGPPVYREPPNPPTHDLGNHHHPDICINSSSPPRPSEPLPYMHHTHHSERPERPGSRTHAWVQEHKTSGKLVGEKWSSLQRKLRSFLSQTTSSKELTEFEKEPSTEEKPKAESFQGTQNLRSEYKMNAPSTSEQRLSYISPSSFNGNSVALSLPPPVNHTHPCRPYQVERHPFAATSNVSEHENEESTDPDQLRDTCNKLFSREQRISWTNYLSPRNCYSNNIKSSYDYDKLVPKEVIGRPSQDKRPDVPPGTENAYGGLAPYPSFSRPHDTSLQQTSYQQSALLSQTASGSCYSKGIQNVSEESNVSIPSSEVKVPRKESETVSSDTLPQSALNNTDCGDGTEVYKSSSESGRGTMHSSMHGSKSVVSPHSSGVSAASNLDTSLDSDHSANGGIWNQQAHDHQNKRYSEDFQKKQVRHIYETPSTSLNFRQAVEKEDQNDASSESLYDNPPPHQSVSLAHSPIASTENSPKLPSKAKYKLSMSSSALNSCSKSNDHLSKTSETSKTSGKKTSVRRTISTNQVNCRHRSGKSSQFAKSSSVGHKLGISHGNSSPKKCSSSPPSRHLSRNQIAFPYYLDNGDPELTSTTTGLDMESLLDDEEDYSSDLSATASTMEPNEVCMIRKQLEGLETMYSEILRLLGVKNSCKANPFANSLDPSRHSRRKLNGSLSSLTGHSSTSRGNHSFVDKRGLSEKRRSRECRTSSANKRLQRLESHVVTLARSVAHLSSEMRTQHVLVQELENMRQDVTWVQERLRLMQLAQGCHPNSGGRNPPLALPRDWDNFHKEVIELLNPCRAKKLTKFFGDEPPLIRQFLKRLGYEKYASNFESEKIGIKELPYLTEERLQKMGIPMGPRIRILQEAMTCYPQNQYKVYIV